MSESTSSRGTPRRSIAANTAMNALAQLASVVSTLVFFPLLVTAFGTGRYGVYVIAVSVVGFVLMFDLGIGASTVRMVAAYRSRDDGARLGVVLATSAALLALLGVVLAAAVAGLGAVAGSVFKVTAEEAALLRTLLTIGAAVQLWYWPTSVAAHALAGLERYDLAARGSLLGTAGNVVAIAIVLVAGWGPVALMALGAGVTVTVSIVNIVSLSRVWSPGRVRMVPSAPVAGEIIAVGTPVFVAGMAQFLNREQADRIIIGVLLGPAAVAVYEVAAKLSMLVAQATGLATSAVLPVASAMAAADDREALRGLFVTGARYVSIAVAPIAVVLAVLARPFVEAWFGPGFEASVAVAVLLLLAQVFVPLYQTGDAILIGAGRFSRWVPWGIGLATLNIGLSLILVGPFGITGVAIGTFVATMLELPLYARIVLAETGVGVRRWLSGSAGAYALLPVCGLLAFGATSLGWTGSLPAVIAAGAVAVGAYWALAWATVLTRAERSRFRARVRRGASSAGEG